MRKGFKRAFLLITLCICCMFSSIFGVRLLSASAASPTQITATTNASVVQGNTGTCYVYIDSTSGLSALDVAVYFDSDKISISSVYNSVSCTLYDNAKTESSVQFSYIFDGKGSTSKTRLFYFTYKVLMTADIGSTYFDIVVGDAYDSALNSMVISGSRCGFTITEKVVSKSCTISSSTTVSTSVNGEFSLAYRLSTYQIASGSFQISYDSELFEIVGITNGAFLGNKAVDINSSLTGSVYVSFVGTEYVSKYDLLTISFQTKKNVTTSSQIKLTVTEFYDKALNFVSCKGYTTTANVAFDDTYTEDSPQMSVSAVYSPESGELTAAVNLAANSCLGAGDFVLSFDTDILSYVSYEKGFSPSFFNVNTKEVGNGLLKFSIISMSDVVTAERILSVTFAVRSSCEARDTVIDISGSGLSDSLTNSILLNFVDGNVALPSAHSFGDWVIVNPATSASAGLEQRECMECGEIETKEIPALGIVLDSEINFGHSCSFHNNLTMNYYIPTSDLTKYNSFYLCVEKDVYADGAWTVQTVNLQGELTTSGYKFVFTGIGAAEAGNELRAVLYAELDGVQYKSITDVYTVKAYAYSRLEKSSDAEFKTLLVDMLNYCAAAQAYFGINPENLVNADLTTEQATLATQTEAEVADMSSTTTLDSATAKIVAKSIVFNSNIEVKFYMDLSAYQSLSGLSLRIVYTDEAGVEHVTTIDSKDFVYDSSVGYYAAKLNNLNSAELRAVLTVEILYDEAVISDTVYYSVETYVYNRLGKTSNETFKTLLKELMKYSDSAKNYFY